MYCFYEGTDKCKYCGLPKAPMHPDQRALIDAGWDETWWMTPEEKLADAISKSYDEARPAGRIVKLTDQGNHE